MSNLLFPKIRGLGWSVTKTPTFNTDIQSSLAGREVRIQNFQNPIWEFTLTYEYLLNDPKFRDETGATPLETLAGFFLARGGQFDDFLLNESDLTQRLEDSVYSGQPIGTGDGSTKSFQLVRNVGGFLEACQNPAGQVASVSVGSSVKVLGVDYTVTQGLVTFVSAPAAAAAITADFTFLHRVRFDIGSSRNGTREGIEFNNFMYQIYECKEIQLISVRK